MADGGGWSDRRDVMEFLDKGMIGRKDGCGQVVRLLLLGEGEAGVCGGAGGGGIQCAWDAWGCFGCRMGRVGAMGGEMWVLRMKEVSWKGGCSQVGVQLLLFVRVKPALYGAVCLLMFYCGWGMWGRFGWRLGMMGGIGPMLWPRKRKQRAGNPVGKSKLWMFADANAQ